MNWLTVSRVKISRHNEEKWVNMKKVERIAMPMVKQRPELDSLIRGPDYDAV